MARTKSGAGSTSNKPTVAEIKEWYQQNKDTILRFANKDAAIRNLRDVTKSTTRTIQTIDKDTLKGYFDNIGGSEKNLRNTARYLYYRSNILYRIINWYAGMWCLDCRKVVPSYDLTKDNDKTKFLKSYNETLDILDIMNMQGNMKEVLVNIYREDVCYAITFMDDTGMFFYVLDPDECIIDSRYSTMDFGFSMDMSKWRSQQRLTIIEFLGSPLKEMYSEYERTNIKYVHCPDEYAMCFKFRSDIWDTVVPPFVSLFLQLSSLEDLVDIQADADALSVYKLIYLPMKAISGSKEIDDFEFTPDLLIQYFDRLVDGGAIPDGVAGAVIPGDELKTIDFSKTVDSDTNSVEQSSNQILQTAGGGAVINTSNITSTASFKAWLKAETQFAISTLMPQVDGFVNRMLAYKVSNPAKVKHFEVSVYTREDLAEKLMESCLYGYSNKIAYNTLLGISEKETLAQNFLEEEVLGLHNIMKYPLSSSFTSTGDSESDVAADGSDGRPLSDDDELSDSGERMRNA